MPRPTRRTAADLPRCAHLRLGRNEPRPLAGRLGRRRTGGAHPEPGHRADRGDGRRHADRPRRSSGTSFPVQAEPGVVTEVALDSGAEVDSGVALADGIYTVTMTADQPVRRRACAPRPPPTSAPIETEGAGRRAGVGPRLVQRLARAARRRCARRDRPRPRPRARRRQPDGCRGGAACSTRRAATTSPSTSRRAARRARRRRGHELRARGAGGLFAAVSYAADDAMAAYPVTSARPVSGPIVIRP